MDSTPRQGDDLASSLLTLGEVRLDNVLEAARTYTRIGLRVTPLNGKDPILTGWPEKKLTEEELPRHFVDGRNVGIVLGGGAGLVDVDLDHPLAIAATDHLLPSTLESGREKNPRSHRWYLCDPLPQSRTYSVPKSMAHSLGIEVTTLVELRSDGRQTAVAPSVHPKDGDSYQWHPAEIRKIDGSELKELVLEAAIATLLALHMTEGSRQQFVLHAAGYLGRHMEHGRVEAILEAAAVAVEDEEHHKRADAVRDTLRKLSGGEVSVTGGRSLEELAPGVPALIARWCGWHFNGGGRAEEGNGKQSQIDRLVGYVEDAELFHTADGKAHATFEVDGHRETWPVGSRRFEKFLRGMFFRDTRKAPATQALKDAMDTIAARAVFEGAEEEVFTRVARGEGAVYVDLCNDRWEALEITTEGWRVVSDPPVKFVRSKYSAALPHPQAGGSLEDLGRFLRVKNRKDYVLVVAWLLGAFNPEGPYVILQVNGEQGSAKSTLVRLLVSLVDPAIPAIRALPRNKHDLAIAANARWVLAFDNLSYIRDDMSDAMCRLSTGGGFGTRTLYTDDEETLFDAKRPQMVNGINRVALHGDLQERCVSITLLPIPPHERRPEKEFLADFGGARPKILGALLDAVSGALRHTDGVQIDKLPRMADFAVWATAAEGTLGWEPGTFMEAYDENLADATQAALETDPVAVAVEGVLGPFRDSWWGTSSELLEALGKHVSDEVKRSKAWPKAPNALSARMNRLAPQLRSRGIEYSEREEGHGKRKVKTLRRVHSEHREGRGAWSRASSGDDRGRAQDAPSDANRAWPLSLAEVLANLDLGED